LLAFTALAVNAAASESISEFFAAWLVSSLRTAGSMVRRLTMVGSLYINVA